MPNEFVIKNGFISQNNSNVSGLLTTTTFRLTSGATNGYVLTSDGSGNATWSPLSAVTGYFDVFVTTGITASTQTLTTGFTYYGIIHTGNVDLTLPSPIGNDGFNLNIKDESGNSGIYRIRITTPSGSIDGNSYVDMNINYMSLHMVARNNNWWLI